MHARQTTLPLSVLNTIFIVFCLFVLWGGMEGTRITRPIPCSALKSVLVLCSGVTSGSAQGTICSGRD